MIPLSERFNEGKDDIRFSIDEEDGIIISNDGFSLDEKMRENTFQIGNKFVTLQTDRDKDAIKNQRKSLPPTASWREGVDKVTVHTSLKHVKQKYGDLHAKAKAGDEIAAIDLVNSIVKEDRIKSIVEQHPNAIVAYVHAEEATGRNRLPAAYALYLEREGLSLSDIVQTNRPGHTGTDKTGRFFRRARFNGEVKDGVEYIIVDDHVTMGGTLRDMKDYIESRGGKVVALTSRDCNPPDRRTNKRINRKRNNK